MQALTFLVSFVCISRLSSFSCTSFFSMSETTKLTQNTGMVFAHDDLLASHRLQPQIYFLKKQLQIQNVHLENLFRHNL